MKRSFHFAAAAALTTLAFAPAANAQTLTINETVTSIDHQFSARRGTLIVRDKLMVNASTPTVTDDLSLYDTYVFHYTAPAGQQFVVSDPGTSYSASLQAYAVQDPAVSTSPGGNTAISFDNLTGTLPAPDGTQTNYGTVNIYGTVTYNALTGPLSFTGYTLTLTGIPSAPTGTHSYYDLLEQSLFTRETSGSTDPGAFVSLQNISTAVPEPGSIALFVGMMTVGASVLRKRRK